MMIWKSDGWRKIKGCGWHQVYCCSNCKIRSYIRFENCPNCKEKMMKEN